MQLALLRDYATNRVLSRAICAASSGACCREAGDNSMTTIGIIGAGEIGSQVARAAIANGYHVVIANSRGPETLRHLADELGPAGRQDRARHEQLHDLA